MAERNLLLQVSLTVITVIKIPHFSVSSPLVQTNAAHWLLVRKTPHCPNLSSSQPVNSSEDPSLSPLKSTIEQGRVSKGFVPVSVLCLDLSFPLKASGAGLLSSLALKAPDCHSHHPWVERVRDQQLFRPVQLPSATPCSDPLASRDP